MSSNDKKYFLKILIFIQIVIIGFLGYNIYQKIKILIVNSVYPIERNRIILNPSDRLKYFYEPKPLTIITKNDHEFPQFAPKYTITINGDTLNERRNYSEEKPKGVYRIVALGDSLTYGLYVNTADNWTELLEDKLNSQLKCKKYQKIEVINLGVYAYDLQYEVERYRLRGQKYNPDLVIWFLIENDSNEITELMLPKVDKYTKEVEKKGEYQEKWKDLGIFYAPAWFRAKSDILKELGTEGVLNFNASMMRSIDNYFQGQILIVTPPRISLTYQSTIENFVRKRKKTTYFNNLNYIYNKNAVFPDNHPNQLGHKLITQDIFDYLIKSKLISCN